MAEAKLKSDFSNKKNWVNVMIGRKDIDAARREIDGCKKILADCDAAGDAQIIAYIESENKWLAEQELLVVAIVQDKSAADAKQSIDGFKNWVTVMMGRSDASQATKSLKDIIDLVAKNSNDEKTNAKLSAICNEARTYISVTQPLIDALILNGEIKVHISNASRNFSWIKTYHERKNGSGALTEYNKALVAHAPLWNDSRYHASFTSSKELQLYMKELNDHESLIGVPLTMPPGVTAIAAAAPIAAVEVKGPPAKINARAHTKHSLEYNGSLSGHSCDECRASCSVAYICKACNYDYCFACYEKGVAAGAVSLPIIVDITSPPAEIQIKGHSAHPLKWYTDIRGHSCDVCRNTLPSSSYQCRPCNYDFCTDCYIQARQVGDANGVGVPEPAPILVTAAAPVAVAVAAVATPVISSSVPHVEINFDGHTKHALKYYTDISGKSCDICRKSFSPLGYQCRTCGFDFCTECSTKALNDGKARPVGASTAAVPVAAPVVVPVAAPVVPIPTPVPVVVATPAASSTSSSSSSSDRPGEIDADCHTKHPLKYYTDITGHVCDLCRASLVPEGYQCRACGFDFCNSCYTKGVDNGSVRPAGVSAAAVAAGISYVSQPSAAPIAMEIKAPEVLIAGTGGATAAQIQAIDRAKNSNNSIINAMSSQIIRFDWSPIDRGILSLKKSLADNTSEWQKTSDGSAYRELLAHDIYRLEQDIAAARIEDEILKHIKALESSISTLNNSRSLTDIPRNRDATQKLCDAKHGLLSTHVQGRDAITNVTRAIESAQSRLDQLQVDAAIKDLNNSIEYPIRRLAAAIADTRNPSLANIESAKKDIEAGLVKHADNISRYAACGAIAETTRKNMAAQEPIIRDISLLLEAEPIIRRADSDYRMISHEVSSSNRIADPCKAYQYWLRGEVHAKLILDRPEMHSVPKVQEFLIERKDYQDRLNNNGSAVIFANELKKSADAIDWKRRQLDSDMDQGKLSDAISHAAELRSLLPPFIDLYGNDSNGRDMIESARKMLRRADTIDQMAADQAVIHATREGSNQLMFVQSYLSSNRLDQVQMVMSTVARIMKDVNQQYASHEKVIEFNKKLERLQAKLPKDPKAIDSIMEKLAIRVPLDVRQAEIAQAKRDPFLAKEVLTRLNASLTLLQTGGECSTHASASLLLSSALPYITTLRVISDETVPEDICSMVIASLVKLNNAITTRNVRSIITYRSIAMERIAELRAILPRATESSRESSNEILIKAENELKLVEPLLPMIADYEVKLAEILYNSTISLARIAISRADVRACKVHLQYLHSLVQPLSVSYQTSPSTISLVTSLNGITNELLAIPKVGDVDIKEVDQFVNELSADIKQASSLPSVESLLLLRSTRVQHGVQQLRTRFGWLPAVRQVLSDADSLHIKLQGCAIPIDTCWAPIILPDWRCSPKENDLQETIAKQLTQFNFRWSIANSEWNTQTLDGLNKVFTTTTFGYIIDGVQGNRDTALGALDQVKVACDELRVLVPGSPIASFATTVEESLRAAHIDKVADMRAVSKYVRGLAHARSLMEASDSERRSDELITDFDQQSRSYGKIMLSLRSALESLEDASSSIPEKCVSAIDVASQVRAKLTIMEDRFRQSCLSYVRQALSSKMVEHGQFNSVNEALERLKQYFASAEEVKIATEAIEARKKAIIEADARRREEYERAQKEEAERVQKLAAQCEAKWIAPYSGGRIEVGSHDTWIYDSKTGDIKNNLPGQPTWTFKVRKGQPECTIHDQKAGWEWGFGVMKEDMSLSIYTEVHNNRWAGHHFTRCWQRYVYDERDKTYSSTLGAYHKFKINPKALNLVEGGQGDYRGDKAVVEGSVPPAVILWCMVHQAFSGKWPNWVAAREEWNELVHVEYERREAFVRARNKGCHSCGQTGNTYMMCYNCGHSACSSKCRQQSFSSCPRCREFADHYNSTPNRTWKQKTAAKLQKKYNDSYDSEWRNCM